MTDHESILRDALKRMDRGAEKYGEFDPETDKRDLLIEMENELIDVINYAVMEIEKLRYLKNSVVWKMVKDIRIEGGQLVIEMPAITEGYK